MDAVNIPAKDGTVISALTVGFDDDNVKAVIIICHGFGEHSGSYTELAGKFCEAGFACIIPNQRGHGLPPEGVKKWHGRIPCYQSFVDDIITLTEYIDAKCSGVPVVLYGHSMGGNIVINTLLRSTEKQAAKYSCAILEAPWLGLHKPPNAISVAALRVINVIMPNMRIVHKMQSGDLSTIPERAEGYVKDPLYHGFLSARMIIGIIDACRYAMENASKLPVPAYLAYAGDDTVVCNKAINSFANAAGECITLKEYRSKHAIHNDVSREEFIDDVTAYINSHTKA